MSAICLRYQQVRGDRLVFSCECAGEGCPDQPPTRLGGVVNEEQCRQKLTWEPADGGMWRRTARCERQTSHAGPHNGQGYTWGKFGVTPPDTAPSSGPVQLCPKCQGQGVVSRPPWVPADVTTWGAPTVAPYRCNLCDGQMVIPA